MRVTEPVTHDEYDLHGWPVPSLMVFCASRTFVTPPASQVPSSLRHRTELGCEGVEDAKRTSTRVELHLGEER